MTNTQKTLPCECAIFAIVPLVFLSDASLNLTCFGARNKTHQFRGQVVVIIQSLPQIFQVLHELIKTRTGVQIIEQGCVALHSIMEASHPVHVNVILPCRDGGQVHEHLQLGDTWGRRGR